MHLSVVLPLEELLFDGSEPSERLLVQLVEMTTTI